MRRYTAKFSIIMLMLIGMLGLTTSVAFAQDPDSGQTAWENNLCQRCHGEMGEGAWAAPLAGDDQLSADEWIEQVRTAGSRMPSFSEEQISDEMIRDIYAYLTSLDFPDQVNRASVDLGDDPHPGQELIVEKRCVACHTATGPISPFNNRGEMPTVEAVLAQLRNPRNMMPTFNEDKVSDEEAGLIAEFLATQFLPQLQAVPSPLEKAVASLGGEAALQSLSTLTMESTGARWVFDEGLTPGGEAAMIGPFTMTVSVDLAGERMRLEHTRQAAGQTRQLTEIIDGEVGYLDGQDARFGPPAQQAMTSDRWASTLRQQFVLNPHMLLLGDPESISDVGEVLFQGTVHHRLQVADEVAPLTLFVNAGTGQIAKLSTMESNPLRRDVPLEVFYYGWQPVGQDGLVFPTELYIAYDGEIVHREIRSAIQVNPELDDALFEIPEDVTAEFDGELAVRGTVSQQFLQMFAHYGFPRDGYQTEVAADELASGVYHLTGGSHHSLAIEQESGVVIVEAPLDEARSEAIMGWVEETFPDKPVSYVVASHHHVDHSAGLRAFAAQGATIVVHEAAEAFFAEHFQADSEVAPDAMTENPVMADIETTPADGALVIPDDTLPVEIHPIANTHAEDMVIAFVPDAGVVFIVDLYNPDPAAESAGAGGQLLADTIADLGLDVSIIAGGHGGVIDFEDFEGQLGE